MASPERQQKQKIFGPRVFCFGWLDHGRCGQEFEGGQTNGGKLPALPGTALVPKSGIGTLGTLAQPGRRSSKLKSGLAAYAKVTNVPLPVNSLTGKETLGQVCDVSAGERHTIAITTRGQVFAFGDNLNGALGSNRLFEGRTSTRSRSSSRAQTPADGSQRGTIVPPLLTDISNNSKEPAAGRIVSQIDSDDVDPELMKSVLAQARWKEDDNLPPIKCTASPVIIDMERAGCRVPVHIHAGGYSSYVLDGNGKVYSWGENSHGQLGIGDVDLFGKSDEEITIELDKLRKGPKVKKPKRWKPPGTVEEAEVDDTESGDSSQPPRKKTGVHITSGSTTGLRRGGGYSIKKGATNAKNKLKKAGNVALAISTTDKGELSVKNQNDGTEDQEDDPFRYGTTVTKDLRFIGAPRPKKRRRPMPRPCLVTPLAHKRVKMLAAGNRHVVALMLGGGLLYSWGFNRYGQLGLGGKDPQDIDLNDRSVPTILPTMRRVRCSYISCGRHYTVALGETNDDRFLGIKEGGRLRRSKATRKCMFVWGQNDSGQFATTKAKTPETPHCHPSCVKAEPIYKPATPDKQIAKVFAGGSHLIMLTESEILASVGNNMYGQLGLGDLYDRDFPHYIDAIGGVKMVAVGARHTMATTQNHILWVWGFNCVGEMGTGNRSLFLLPEPVKAMRELRATALSAGYWHSAIIATDMPDESVPMWREPNCHPTMQVEDDDEGHDSLVVVHRVSQDDLDDPMYEPEFVHVALANPPVSNREKFRWDLKVNHLSGGHSIPAMIGVALDSVELALDPNLQEGAMVYMSTGEKFNADDFEVPEEYAEPWWWDDVIGVEINREVGYVRFYKNGVDQGIAFYADWPEDARVHLYVALAGDGDKISIIDDPNASGRGAKEAILGGKGKLLCDNIMLAEKGAAPLDVFFECMSCRVTVCRSCAYQCHNGHSCNLLISFGNLRCACVRSAVEDHECLSLPEIGDEDALDAIKGGPSRARRSRKRERRVQRYSVIQPAKTTFRQILESDPIPEGGDDAKVSGKKNFAGF